METINSDPELRDFCVHLQIGIGCYVPSASLYRHPDDGEYASNIKYYLMKSAVAGEREMSQYICVLITFTSKVTRIALPSICSHW